MRATEKGLRLARKLGPAVGFAAETSSICSLICRNIATWHTLTEKLPDCHPANSYPRLSSETAALLQDVANARIVHQKYRTEKRLETLVTSLPETDCGPWRLDLTRDPRSNAVLLPPEGCTCVDSDDRDGRGVVIP
jgi:hypothetical protein